MKPRAEDLPDDNTVGDPVEGERKLHQWLSAANSFENYIGMIPRSAPYVPPEQRPPADFKPVREVLDVRGKQLWTAICVAGAAFGLVGAYFHGADLSQSPDDEAPGMQLIRLAFGGLLGVLAAAAPGFCVALMFTKKRYQKADDDTGRDRPEAT
ncbi:MAG: hypothetical protein IT464_08595 [Planctomycetes bacterium]|nr:hypothetical protein [Planctomycetota bacterium]